LERAWKLDFCFHVLTLPNPACESSDLLP
jgi:hypothetical protein